MTAVHQPAQWQQPLPPHIRHDRLNQAVIRELTTGARIQTQGDFYVVLLRGHGVNNILHLLLTVFTAGLWLPIWLIVAMTNKETRAVMSVDEYGTVTEANTYGIPAARR